MRLLRLWFVTGMTVKMDALDIGTKKREKYLKSKIQGPFPHPPTDSEMSFHVRFSSDRS